MHFSTLVKMIGKNSNGTIGKPVVPLATNGTVGNITNGTIGRTPNRAKIWSTEVATQQPC